MHFVFLDHFNENDMRQTSKGTHKKLKNLNFTKRIEDVGQAQNSTVEHWTRDHV
jgi:hypothetical protein